jgi:small-conductance mechanosensitive channel
VVREFAKRLKPQPGEHLGYAGIVGRCAARTNHFFMIMVSAKLVAGYANPPETVGRTVTFLFILAAVFQSAIWARELILSLVERRTEDDTHGETLANAMGIIRLLVSVVLFSIATIVVLDNLGVNVTGLVAGLGIGGIAIGLAAQGIFSDLFAALSIIFDKPFRTGETIQYDTTTATVQRIGLKSTRMIAPTGEYKIVSNANLLQKEITNLTGLDSRRIKYRLGVIYQTDVDKAIAIPAMLEEIVKAERATFVRAGFVNFGDSSLDFEMEFDVFESDWDAVYAVRSAVGLSILRRFNAEGLEFAYPTQTSFTAAPDGRAVMPYPEAMPVMRMDLTESELAPPPTKRKRAPKA